MKKIAIIGTGISGMVSAYLLSQKYSVTVFEKNDYIGGHTATKSVEVNGEEFQIDTGFIVCNDKTYPNFLKLLSQIGVSLQPTEMSFSVNNTKTGLEYNGNNLNTLFAQRSNIFSLQFWQLIREILKFNKLGKSWLETNGSDTGQSLGQFLEEHGFSDFFCEHYLYPMGAAIWSASLDEMKDIPLLFFVRFFENHGLLNVNDRPQWYVIPGGSKNYIDPLIKNFENDIVLNAEIKSVKRVSSSVEIHFSNGKVDVFDDVVFACHSDQALALLSDASEEEQRVLGDIPYSHNSVVLHTDKTLLPKRQKAWASWNYQLVGDREKPASVTYNMNILQSLKSDTTFCVTLNQDEAIDPNKILGQYTYHHPVFNRKSINAQSQRHLICGKNNTHFAGAYWYNGFHEDGVRSALDVAARFGLTL